MIIVIMIIIIIIIIIIIVIIIIIKRSYMVHNFLELNVPYNYIIHMSKKKLKSKFRCRERVSRICHI